MIKIYLGSTKSAYLSLKFAVNFGTKHMKTCTCEQDIGKNSGGDGYGLRRGLNLIKA